MSSYIYFCRAADVDDVNKVIEENDYGPDSISIDLVSTIDQEKWKGSHSFVDLLVPQVRFQQAVTTVIYEGGDPITNWNTALADNNLGKVEVPNELPTIDAAGSTDRAPARPEQPDVQLRTKRNRKAKSKADAGTTTTGKRHGHKRDTD